MAYKNPIPSIDYQEEENDKQKYVYNESDYTINKSVYFAFIDVLGFKQAFDDIRNSKEKQDIDKFKDVFTYYFDLMDSLGFIIDSSGVVTAGRSVSYAGQTSDSLYFYTERADYLLQFLKVFSHINAYAMTKDVFFRGGVAQGSLYHKAYYQFYGESVIFAYLLESDVSKNPIIVIDENTYMALKDIPGSKDLIDIEKSRHYIKPFAFIEHNFDLNIDPIKIRDINIDSIRKMIEQNKTKFEYDSKNYEKYIFLLDKYQKLNKNA